MSELNNYESYKIPARNTLQGNEPGVAQIRKATGSVSFEQQFFAEIEIDNGQKNVYEPAPIPQPANPYMDEKRRKFTSMREISWNSHSPYMSNFYNKQSHEHHSRIFYKQAVFMKDFEDDYTASAPFSSYFPYYQLMSYEQLRTYFTWRTKVRKGHIEPISLSYAFVYFYELINNIGVSGPADGLNKLMAFWKSYKIYNSAVDKYMIRWLKDYHIYYELPKSFKEFLCENNLQHHYQDIISYEPGMNSSFEYFSNISKYNISKSAFYNDNTSQMISDCFNFVLNQLKSTFEKAGIKMNHLLFQSVKSKTVWTPFKDALFYPALKQLDRQVVLTKDEVYTCSQNLWVLSSISTTDSGRQLIGYIIKQLEVVLRKLTDYKYKLTASTEMINGELLQTLGAAGIFLEKAVTAAVQEFYRERNKTVVSVDENALNRIRLEALGTQEKLIVPEIDLSSKAPSYSRDTSPAVKDDQASSVAPAVKEKQAAPIAPSVKEEPTSSTESAAKENQAPPLTPAGVSSLSDSWTSFKEALNETEIHALAAVLLGDKDIKQFADAHGIMLEVLADSINEKAFDCIGDNILELTDSMTIYDEYIEKLMIMVG